MRSTLANRYRVTFRRPGYLVDHEYIVIARSETAARSDFFETHTDPKFYLVSIEVIEEGVDILELITRRGFQR